MNRTAIITGGSKGLGKTIAAFLARQDYKIIITARYEEPLLLTAKELTAFSSEIFPLQGDISDPAHRKEIIRTAENFGGIDLLINNASTLGPTPMPELKDISTEAFRKIFEINTLSPLALIQEALPLLQNSFGTVVNISSDAAVGGYETWGGYGASKAALDLISRTLANELSGSGVTVISVDPGDMRTDMHQAAFPGEDITDRPMPEVTLPFWGWLLGQKSESVNGQRFNAQAEQWKLQDVAA